jgi:hypothetical protein
LLLRKRHFNEADTLFLQRKTAVVFPRAPRDCF